MEDKELETLVDTILERVDARVDEKLAGVEERLAAAEEKLTTAYVDSGDIEEAPAEEVAVEEAPAEEVKVEEEAKPISNLQKIINKIKGIKD